MSEWDKLKELHHAWDHTKSGSRYVELLLSVGDKLQEENKLLKAEYELLRKVEHRVSKKQFELEQKLEAIRSLFKNPPFMHEEAIVCDYDYEKWAEKILGVLNDE